ncbi:rhodopsin, GQ-coupled-like [Diadema setosum]|uniref:rhodopsin, GQ-coupled-like n=1 Tax=Diadema setosum TaxID=31175 RepID=UPI003B3B2436
MASRGCYQDRNETLAEPSSSLAPGDICLAVGFSTVFVVGVTGNIMLLVASTLSRKLQTKTSCLVVNLSVSDLLASAVQPFQVVPMLGRNRRALSEALYQLTAAISIISIGSSIVTIMLIAVNRCVLIIKPRHTYNRVFSSRNLVVMVIMSWLYPAAVLVVPQLTGHGRLGYSALTRLCIWDFTQKNAHTFVHVKRSALKSKSRSMTTEKRCLKHTELVITKNLVCVVCCFVLCTTPFMAVFLAILFLQGPTLQRVVSLTPYVSLPLVLDSCLNPFIYGWKHPHFRVVMACVLRRRWRDIPEPSRLLARILDYNTGDRQTLQVFSAAKGCETQSESVNIETKNI